MDLIIEILLIVDPEVLSVSSTPLLPEVTTTATIPKPTTTIVTSTQVPVTSAKVPVTTTTMERYTLSSDGPKNTLPSIFVLVFAFILHMVFF